MKSEEHSAKIPPSGASLSSVLTARRGGGVEAFSPVCSLTYRVFPFDPKSDVGTRVFAFVTTFGLLLIVLAFAASHASAAIGYAQFGQISGPTPDTHFGMLLPESVAVDDANGHVYVADSSDGLVYDFSSPADQHPTVWNGSGTPTGSLGGSTIAIAADNSSGDVYVADYNDKLIDKFDSAGNLIASFGDASHAQDGQLTGAATPAGFFAPPSNGTKKFLTFDIAVDQTTGDLYVTDAGHQVIDIFNSSGEYLRQIAVVPPFGNVGGLGETPQGLAVDGLHSRIYAFDNSGGGGEHIDVFSTSGNPLETIASDGSEGAIAVNNSSGDLYRAQRSANLVRYGTSGTVLDQSAIPFHAQTEESVAVAVDQASGRIFISGSGLFGGPRGVVGILGPTPEHLPVATTGNVSEISKTTAKISGAINPEETEASYQFEYGAENPYYGEKAPTLPAAVGKDNSSHPVSQELTDLTPGTTYHYRVDGIRPDGGTATGADASFHTLGPPSIDGQSVGSVFNSAGVVETQINPSGFDTTFKVEYGTAEGVYSFESAPVDVGSADADQSASTELTELKASTVYHYRVLAANHCNPAEPAEVCSVESNEGTFQTRPPLSIDFTTISDVTASKATVTTEINPSGPLLTAFHVEFITEADYIHNLEEAVDPFAGATKVPQPDASVGSGVHDIEVSQGLQGLQPETIYRYRVVGSNEVAPQGVAGPTDTFVTYSAKAGSSSCPNENLRAENGSLDLPDCRAYELVSPASSSSEVYAPGEGGELPTLSSGAATRAAGSGESLVYVADPSAEGGNGAQGNGLGNQWLARRTTAGWSAGDINPVALSPGNAAPGYQAFSNDLSRGVLLSLAPDPATGRIPSLAEGSVPGCRMLYMHSGLDADTGFSPLITQTQESGPYEDLRCGNPLFAAATPDFSAFAFQTEAALSPHSVPSQGPEEFRARCIFNCDLYFSRAGTLPELVDVLPNGTQASGATYGGPGGLYTHRAIPDLDGSLSADGTRAFWTDTSTGKVYVREGLGSGEAHTVQVSAGAAQYWAATPDGRYAYYVEKGALMRFNVEGAAGHQRETLVAGSGMVEGVVGINEAGADGAYLYFVAKGSLTGSEQNSVGSLAQAGQPNLYLLHEGVLSFIATLSAEDNEYELSNSMIPTTAGFLAGDWQPDIGQRTVEVTPDGRGLVFQSVLNLTGANAGFEAFSAYDYDTTSGVLACISCNPSGAPERHEVGIRTRNGGGLLPSSSEATYQRHLISTDGSRVIFETQQALVPGDTDGVQDVYEWQRPGSAGCSQREASPFTGGCVRLISDGGGQAPSYLVEADSSADNIFFATYDQLTPAAPNGQVRMFDARVDGGFPSPSPLPPCESAGACHGATTQVSPVASAATQHFEGGGNPSVSSCPKAKVRHGGHCVKRGSHKRRRHHRSGRHHRRHTTHDPKGGAR